MDIVEPYKTDYNNLSGAKLTVFLGLIFSYCRYIFFWNYCSITTIFHFLSNDINHYCAKYNDHTIALVFVPDGSIKIMHCQSLHSKI